MIYNDENKAKTAAVCSSCGTPVITGCMFCIQCGTKVEILPKNVCPNCQFENKDDTMFCIKCGTSLSGKHAAAPAPAASHVPLAPAYVPYMPVYAPPTPVYVQPAPAPSPKNVCPNCSFENKDDTVFCIKCGTSLAGRPAPAPTPATAYVQQAPAYVPTAPAYVPTAAAYTPVYYSPPKPVYAPQYAPAPPYTPQYASAPSPSAGQLRNINITRESQFVCAANSYKVIVNGLPLGNIPVGQTMVATVDTDVADVEIICTTIMINKKLRLKLSLGANPVISFNVQWPGDIFETVRDARVLEKSINL